MIVEGEMQVNEFGHLAEECINALFHEEVGHQIDEYVVMPNHIHLIVVIRSEDDNVQPSQPSVLMKVVRSIKSCITRRSNQLRGTPGAPVLQPDYYEHVIRDDLDPKAIREYILNNPAKWSEDRENPEREVIPGV